MDDLAPLALATLALAAVGGYLLGSVPFGLVLSKAAGYDLRSIGSGNIGATNVLRTGRKDLALATLILDSSKGAVACAIALWAVGSAPVVLAAGIGAVLGHNFPAWLKFKGGKGVATTLGVLLVSAWPVGVATCLTWAVTAALFRYSSLAALVSLALAPVYALLWATPLHAGAFAALALLSFVRHHENLRRLLKGEESKIGSKKKASE